MYAYFLMPFYLKQLEYVQTVYYDNLIIIYTILDAVEFFATNTVWTDTRTKI